MNELIFSLDDDTHSTFKTQNIYIYSVFPMRESRAMNSKNAGIVLVISASIMWAIEPVLAKLSYHTSGFMQTLTARSIFVTLIAFVYASITNKANFRIDRRQLSALLYVAIVANILGDIAYFFALTRVAVVNAVLIGNLQPIFIIVIGFIILREDRLNTADYIGIVLMIGGGILIATKTFENLLTLRLGTFNDLIVLSATIGWATTTIAVRKYLRGLNAGVVNFYRFVFVSPLFLIYFLSTTRFVTLNLYQIAIGIIVGVGMILYTEGLNRIKAAKVAALELSTPLFAAILGYLILGELVSFLQIMGMAILFVGIYLISKKEEPIPYRCC
jgi:drug/metabolite transporter (DMT)-like permease